MRHQSLPPSRAARCVAACSIVLAACSAGLTAPPALPRADTTTMPTSAGPPVAPAVPTVPDPAVSNPAVTEPTVTEPTVAGPTATAPFEASTTVPISLFPASPIDSTTVLTPGGPWTRVDAAPGVGTPGLFYELRPRVWVYLPIAEDIPHGILWTLRDDALPMIEGYLRAQAARLAPGSNVVLRPQVLGDDRTDTTALVADCVLSVADGSKTGWGASMELRDGQWVVVESGPREDACWFV